MTKPKAKRITDTQRLDWLSNCGDFGVSNDLRGGEEKYFFISGIAGKEPDEWWPTLREAIDAAIRAGRGK